MKLTNLLSYSDFQILPADHILIQPNYIYGLGHYGLQVVVTILADPSLGKTLSLGGLFATAYFSYAMYDLGVLCIACIIGHMVNLALYYIDFFSSKTKAKKDQDPLPDLKFEQIFQPVCINFVFLKIQKKIDKIFKIVQWPSKITDQTSSIAPLSNLNYPIL